MPMKRHLYPKNWKTIALIVKTLADWRCQECDRLNFGDVMEGLTKLYKNIYKNNEESPILQLNLFEMIANEHP